MDMRNKSIGSRKKKTLSGAYFNVLWGFLTGDLEDKVQTNCALIEAKNISTTHSAELYLQTTSGGKKILHWVRDISGSQSTHHWHSRMLYPHLVQLILHPPHGQSSSNWDADQWLEENPTTQCVWEKEYPKRSRKQTSGVTHHHPQKVPGTNLPGRQWSSVCRFRTGKFSTTPKSGPTMCMWQGASNETRHCSLSISKTKENNIKLSRKYGSASYCKERGRGGPMIMYLTENEEFCSLLIWGSKSWCEV